MTARCPGMTEKSLRGEDLAADSDPAATGRDLHEARRMQWAGTGGKECLGWVGRCAPGGRDERCESAYRTDGASGRADAPMGERLPPPGALGAAGSTRRSREHAAQPGARRGAARTCPARSGITALAPLRRNQDQHPENRSGGPPEEGQAAAVLCLLTVTALVNRDRRTRL